MTSLRLQLDSRVRLVERLASSRSGVLRPAKHNEEQRQTIGGSKNAIKSVGPFPTYIIKSIGSVQPKRNMYSPYGAILKAKQDHPYEQENEEYVHLVYLPLLHAFLSITALATYVGWRLFATARQNTLVEIIVMMAATVRSSPLMI